MAQSVKPVDAGVSVGQVYQGKYRVDAILGHGGMGVVAECTHLALNERVAIKMLRQDVLTDQDAVARFIREAQAAVKLKSEYVARVSDVGTFENGVPYMVMEFLEGHDLGELLKQRGVLPVQWAVELMLQTAEALAEAHSLSIVHRDVKPTNLFVTWRPDGSALIKVLDFGISKSPMGTDMNLTQTQSLLGTPAYMSPEQMRSARLVDTRTDIWSLGTVFYEILEGRRPFEAESFSEMCVKVAVDPPMPMVNTPPALQQVILRCLAKAPEQRYANMSELGRDLIPFAADPHSAQMLVERMARMLRRASHGDWDGGSGVTGRGSSPHISRPVRAQTPAPQQWSRGSDPAAQPWTPGTDPAAAPWNAKSDPNAQPWHGSTPRGDGSQPFAKPLPNDPSHGSARPVEESATGYVGTTVSTRRSKWPVLMILLAGLGAAGAGVGIYMSSKHDKPMAQQAASENAPSTVQLPATPTPTGAQTPTPSPTQPAEVKAEPATPTAAAPTEVKAPGDTTAVPSTEAKADIKADAKLDTKAEIKKAPTKPGTTTKVTKAVKSTTTAKPDAKATKPNGLMDPNAETKQPEPVQKPAAKPCNPFESMHGCSAK